MREREESVALLQIYEDDFITNKYKSDLGTTMNMQSNSYGNLKDLLSSRKSIGIFTIALLGILVGTTCSFNRSYALTDTTAAAITISPTIVDVNNNNIANTSLSNTNAGIAQNITTTSNASALIKPSSLEEEHKRIHEELEKIVTSEGNTSKVAKEVQSVMQPHFEKEEQLSIPVLGALQPYVNGTLTPEARNQQ